MIPTISKPQPWTMVDGRYVGGYYRHACAKRMQARSAWLFPEGLYKFILGFADSNFVLRILTLYIYYLYILFIYIIYIYIIYIYYKNS